MIRYLPAASVLAFALALAGCDKPGTPDSPDDTPPPVDDTEDPPADDDPRRSMTCWSMRTARSSPIIRRANSFPERASEHPRRHDGL